MLQKVLTFIKYNNLTAIIISVIFGGVGVTFAASPAVADSVYSSSQSITSIDNSVILATNFGTFDFALKINSVTEDSENYYAVYSYKTIKIEEGAWVRSSVTKTFQMAKSALAGKDFGLYLGGQLSDNMKAELEYLKRVQSIERGKGVSQKVITTEYRGLVGKMIDPDRKIVAGYTPVIPDVVATSSQSLASVVTSQQSITQPASDSNITQLPPGPSLVINEGEIKRLVDFYLSQHPRTQLESNLVNSVGETQEGGGSEPETPKDNAPATTTPSVEDQKSNTPATSTQPVETPKETGSTSPSTLGEQTSVKNSEPVTVPTTEVPPTTN